MAGMTKKEGRIPPLLPQTRSSSSLSLLPSLSLFIIAPSSALYVDGVAFPDLFVSPLGTQPSRAASSSQYPRHSLSPFFLSLSHPWLSFSFSHPLAHSRWVAGACSSLTLIVLALAEWEKSQSPPKLRLRPGHARHPPSPLRRSLPLFLLPLSPRSTHLTLSPRRVFPPRIVVVAAEQRYRQAVVIARRRCHHPFPSSPLLPSLPSLTLLQLDRRRAPAPLSCRCLGHGRTVRDRNTAQAMATPPPSTAPLLLLLLLYFPFYYLSLSL